MVEIRALFMEVRFIDQGNATVSDLTTVMQRVLQTVSVTNFSQRNGCCTSWKWAYSEELFLTFWCYGCSVGIVTLIPAPSY